jgi:hypothetical protein
LHLSGFYGSKRLEASPSEHVKDSSFKGVPAFLLPGHPICSGTLELDQKGAQVFRVLFNNMTNKEGN